jgi:hypothetical protein
MVLRYVPWHTIVDVVPYVLPLDVYLKVRVSSPSSHAVGNFVGIVYRGSDSYIDLVGNPHVTFRVYAMDNNFYHTVFERICPNRNRYTESVLDLSTFTSCTRFKLSDAALMINWWMVDSFKSEIFLTGDIGGGL